MIFKVIVEPPAVADVESARATLAEWSEASANRWYESVKSQIQSLSHMPRRYVIAPESIHFGREIRQVIVGKYRVLFAINDANPNNPMVHVIHVRPAALPPLTAEEGI